MTLHNFRRFSELRIELKTPLTVIFGNTETGKSTVIEATAIAAGTLPEAMDRLTARCIKKADAHYEPYDLKNSKEIQPCFPVKITAVGEIENKEISWMRSLKSEKGRESLAGAKELTAIGEEYLKRMRGGDQTLRLPILVYYGADRCRVTDKRKKKGTVTKSNRSNGYLGSLNGIFSDTQMKRWFQKKTIQQYQQGRELPEFQAVLMALQRFFSDMTGFLDVKVRYNLQRDEIELQYTDNNQKNTEILLSQLEDVYRDGIHLITDIAYRMAVLNPQLLGHVLTETDGIVLIDEVERNLPVHWKERILHELMGLFPRVQFVVSTNATEVLTAVEEESRIELDASSN